MPANMRSLLVAFLLGRLVKKNQGPLAWIVVGTNLAFGLMVIYWLANKRLPGPLPSPSEVLEKNPQALKMFATFLPEEAPQG